MENYAHSRAPAHTGSAGVLNPTAHHPWFALIPVDRYMKVLGSIQFGRFIIPSSVESGGGRARSGCWAHEERLEGPCRKLSFAVVVAELLSFFCGVSISLEPPLPQSAGQIEAARLAVQGGFPAPIVCWDLGGKVRRGKDCLSRD